MHTKTRTLFTIVGSLLLTLPLQLLALEDQENPAKTLEVENRCTRLFGSATSIRSKMGKSSVHFCRTYRKVDLTSGNLFESAKSLWEQNQSLSPTHRKPIWQMEEQLTNQAQVNKDLLECPAGSFLGAKPNLQFYSMDQFTGISIEYFCDSNSLLEKELCGDDAKLRVLESIGEIVCMKLQP